MPNVNVQLIFAMTKMKIMTIRVNCTNPMVNLVMALVNAVKNGLETTVIS